MATTTKIHNNWQVMIVVLIIGMVVGYFAGEKKEMKNCAQLGVEVLEMGKRNLNITDFDSLEWDGLIKFETKLVNDCYKLIK